MNQTAILEWLPQLQRIGVALVIGFVPALIARWKRRPMTPWYLYGFRMRPLSLARGSRCCDPRASCSTPRQSLGRSANSVAGPAR